MPKSRELIVDQAEAMAVRGDFGRGAEYTPIADFWLNRLAIDVSSTEVRLLQDLPCFIWTDWKEYGPWIAGTIVRVPNKLAKLMLFRKFGEVAP